MPEIPLTFSTRRQNTNRGQDQFRIWAPRSEADRLAKFLPDLQAALASGTTCTWPVIITWNNGACPKKMDFGTYHDHAGQLAFTASKETYLFDFARDNPDAVIRSKYLIHWVHPPRLNLDLDLLY